jgi:hypothetical protein
MKNLKESDKIHRIEQEIVRKERLARDAKDKGMHTTYSNYLMDVAVLKTRLNRLSTGPLRQVS